MNTYRLKSKKMKGFALVTYDENAILNSFKMAFKGTLNEAQINAFKEYFQYLLKESDLDNFKKIGFEVTIEADKSAKRQKMGENAALWCKHYNQHHPAKYKLNNREIVILGELTDINDTLLELYMKCDEWWAKPKSVGNYASRINEIILLATEKKEQSNKQPLVQAKGEFINYWNKQYESTLEGQKLSKYWAHLRAIGWKPIKNEITKQVIRWEKIENDG